MGDLSYLLKKLNNINEEAGGKKTNSSDEEATTYEAMKVLICSKIESTKNLIQKRNEKKLTPSAKAKINQNIKSMIQFIQNDRKKLGKMKKPENEDLNLIDQHIQDLEKKEKQRYQDLEYKEYSNPNFENNLDNEQSKLPPLDITKSLEKIHKFKQKLDQGISDLSQKMDKLKGIVSETSEELDSQNLQIQEINQKVDTETSALLKLNKSIEKSDVEVNTSTRLCVILILMMVFLFVFSVFVIYLSILLSVKK